MPKFIIERDVPGIGDWPLEKLEQIVDTLRGALKTTNGTIQWVETFLTADKVFSFYIAPDEASLQEFLKQSPLPPGPMHRVLRYADPAYGEYAS